MTAKTPDEIKKALECCFHESEQCADCPYYPVSCDRELVRDAREYIRQLEAEWDALNNDIRMEGGLCALCKHSGVRACEEPCRGCNALLISNESKWEWRGIQKEK